VANPRAWCEDAADTATGLAPGARPEYQTQEEPQMTNGRATSGWAGGLILFAGLMMIMVGIWQALEGLIAIFENEFYVATRNYLFQFDATTWGWIHLILGLLVAFAGYGLLSGRTWARVVAITLAVLSAIANFLWLPYYPFWSMLIIAVDIFVIWAVAAHGREAPL
jgi:hypothetical protein